MFMHVQRTYRPLVTSLFAAAFISIVLSWPSMADEWQVLSGAELQATVDNKTWKGGRYWRVYWGPDGQRLHWSQETQRVNEEKWWAEPDGKTLCADSEARGRLCIQVEERGETFRAVELEGPYAGQKFDFTLLDGKVDF